MAVRAWVATTLSQPCVCQRELASTEEGCAPAAAEAARAWDRALLVHRGAHMPAGDALALLNCAPEDYLLDSDPEVRS